MKNKMLLVDYNNIVYRAVFANLDLSHKGKFTGGIYGFLNMVAGTVNRYGLNRLIVCKDKKPYHRADVYPDYKGNRKKEMDEDVIMRLTKTKKYINQFLDRFEIPVAEKRGYEADDFIGRFCKKMHRRGEVFVMSNDSDFYQFLTSYNVFLVKTGGLYGRKQFRKDYPDVLPENWPLIVALTGSHNGVPGIKGVGEKTAVKILKEHRGKMGIYVEEKYGEEHTQSIVALRQRLSTFPFPLAARPVLPKIRPMRYDANAFEKICDKHGIRFKNDFHDAFMRLSK